MNNCSEPVVADPSLRGVTLSEHLSGSRRERDDVVAVEEPLEIQVVAGDDEIALTHSIAVTMRTPGHDFELALGFLFTEGVIADMAMVKNVVWRDEELGREGLCNVVRVVLKPGNPFDAARFSRHVFTSSSCGICGKMTIENIRAGRLENPRITRPVPASLLRALPERLRAIQPIFEKTGGLHASALFDLEGRLLLVREDVGRHNALDKVIGALLTHNRLPATDTILLLSGRASFELVQKAVLAGMPVMAAVGAPSSLAVDLAREFDLTLAGFVSSRRLNLYAGDKNLT